LNFPFYHGIQTEHVEQSTWTVQQANCGWCSYALEIEEQCLV
jgi:hypothetical protein